MSFALQVAAKTDVGCVRSNNEDSFGYDVPHGIFVVCDGMGGQAAGEVASKIAVQSVLGYFDHGLPESLVDGEEIPIASGHSAFLTCAIRSANTAVRKAAGLDDKKAGMGSTIACALVDGNLVSIGHVGDSRAYLVRHGAIRQLTKDHSLVMEQVHMGLMSAAQVKDSNVRNVITRALGPEEVVEPDCDDVIVDIDDVLVLATDGLTNILEDEEIAAVIASARDIEIACGELIRLAKEKGCDDNVTCLLIRFVEEPWYQSILRAMRFWRTSHGTAIS